MIFMIPFSSLIVYSNGIVEQIPPGIFQSTCKVFFLTPLGRRQRFGFHFLSKILTCKKLEKEVLLWSSWFGAKENRYCIVFIGGHDLVPLWRTDLWPQVWNLDQPRKPGEKNSVVLHQLYLLQVKLFFRSSSPEELDLKNCISFRTNHTIIPGSHGWSCLTPGVTMGAWKKKALHNCIFFRWT